MMGLMNRLDGPRSTGQLVVAWIMIAIGTAGAVACLVALYRAMRSLMVESGGFCSSGGPYVIANECDEGTAVMLTIAIPLGLLFMGVRALFTTWVRGPGFGIFPAMGIMFAVLGYNFVELGFDPPGEASRSWGWIVSGIVFWAMALGFLAPLIWRVPRWFRHREHLGQGSPLTDAFGSSIGLGSTPPDEIDLANSPYPPPPGGYPPPGGRDPRGGAR